jgi:sugar diacid utilization regulator
MAESSASSPDALPAGLVLGRYGSAEYVDRAVAGKAAPPPGREAFDALFEIFRELQETESNLDDVFALIVEKARRLLRTDMAWATMVDHDHGTQHVHASNGARTKEFPGLEMDLGTGIGGAALLRQRTLVVTDYASHSHVTPPHVRQAILHEGLASLISAPMIVRGTSVGLLYVGNRTRTSFGEEHCSILSMLAAQASLAIWNGRLHRELERRHDALERSFAIHRELTSAALRGGGIEGITDTLAELLGREIAVDASCEGQDDADPARFALATAPRVPSATVPIIVGSSRVGFVGAFGAALSELEERALQHGAAAIALELLKERGARAVESRLQGKLLEDLVEAQPPISDGMALRATRLGVALELSRVILVLERVSETLDAGALLAAARAVATEIVDRDHGTVLACRRGGRVILAVPLREAGTGSQIAMHVQRSLARSNMAVTVGVSRPGNDFHASCLEASACAELGMRAGPRTVIVDAAALGAMRFVLDTPDLTTAAEIVRERLGVLEQQDRPGKAPLLDTLRAYLDSGGHHPTTAAACSIHRSSLKYRLGRIQRLLGAPLTDAELRFELSLAFRVLDLLEAVGLDPLGRGKQPQPVG